MVDAQKVKALREKTGAGMMDCKKALQDSGGDEEKAINWLREKGLSKAQKRAGRATSEGWIGSYIHSNGKIGVLVELKCETDFVAKSDQFQQLARDLAMQIAATSPVCVNPEDLPRELVDKERDFYKSQAEKEGKPEHIAEKIVQGRLDKYYKEVCLLKQAYIKDDSKTIEDLINDTVVVLGESIQIGRFTRLGLGEDVQD